MTNPTIPIPSSQKDGRFRPSLLLKTCMPSLYRLRTVNPTAFVSSSIQLSISHFSPFSQKLHRSHPSHLSPTDSCQNVGIGHALSATQIRKFPAFPRIPRIPQFPAFPKKFIHPISASRTSRTARASRTYV